MPASQIKAEFRHHPARFGDSGDDFCGRIGTGYQFLQILESADGIEFVL